MKRDTDTATEGTVGEDNAIILDLGALTGVLYDQLRPLTTRDRAAVIRALIFLFRPFARHHDSDEDEPR
jgi:hypothetical protein